MPDNEGTGHVQSMTFMKGVFSHIRVVVFRGILAIIPILMCLAAVGLLYVLIDRRVMGFLNSVFSLPRIPGMGIIVLVLVLYLIGLIVGNVIGHQFMKFIGKISEQIPLINTIYGVGKQLSQGISAVDGGKQAFQKAVLVKLGGEGLMIPGFVMSTLKGRNDGEEYFFVLVPTAPTPASGFVCVVRSSEIFDPGWTVEECLKAVVSVGIVSPRESLQVSGEDTGRAKKGGQDES